MRARTWVRFVTATGLALSSALTLGVMQAPVAQADTSPAVPNDPTNPETVSTKPLPTVQIDGVVWSQTVVGNTVYVAGQFNTARPAGSAPGVNTVVRSNLLAYDITTGNLISTWVANANGAAQVVTASPDGQHIYVGGSFTTITGSNGTAVTRRRIASLDPVTGAVQNGFNPNPDAKVNAITATNSAVYFGGTFGTAGGATRTRLAAWQPAATGNGTLLTWAPAAVGGQVAALTMTPDGTKVIAGGQFTTMNGSGSPQGYGMAAMDPTSGALVPWAAAATIRNAGPNAGINSLTTDSDSVYATGFTFGSGGVLEGTSRINNDGTINWVEDCHGDTYSSFPRNGVVYKVGHAHYCGNIPGGFAQPQTWRFFRGLAVTKQATGVARADYLGYANWAGTKDPSLVQWFPQLDAGDFTGQTQAAWSLAGNANYVVAGGEFPKADGMAQQGLVRYAAKSVGSGTEAPDLTFGKWIPTVTSPGSGQALISWQSNYDRDSRNLTYKVYRNGALINTQTQGSNLWDRPFMNFLDTGQAVGSTVQYRVSAFDSEGNEARSNTVSVTIAGTGTGPDVYSQAVLKDGPQSYWRMDEAAGSGMADYTGLDPMTAQAGVTRTASGAISGRGAATFNGSASQTAASGTLQEGPWWFSVEAWFKTSTTQGGRIVGFSGTQTGTSAANNYDRAIYMSSNGKLNFGAKQSSNRIVTSNASYNNNQWHHVVGVIGDSGTNLYVDGQLVGNRQDLHTAGSYSGYWRVGGDTLSGWNNRPSSDYFNGSVDDVAVYQQALSGNQVRDHFLAGGGAVSAPSDVYGKAVYNSGPDMYWRFGESTGTNAADSSGNGQAGTYAGGTTLGGASAVGVGTDKSITLNGSTGNVASNNTALTSPPVYSEEAWFKTSTTTGGQLIGFGSSKTGASTTFDRQVYLTNAGTLKFAVSPSNVDTSIESPAGTAYNDSKWHQVVATQGATGMTLYVDGVAVASGPTTNALSYNGYWRVGGDNLTGRSSKPTSTYLNGSVDEVAVYSTVLSASDVQAHFTKAGGTTPNQPPVAAFTSSKQFLAASFDASGSSDPDGTIASYDWDFGDGTTPHGTGKTPTHAYTADGTYHVTLTVTDDQGAAKSITQDITVAGNKAPTAAFTPTTTLNSASFDASASSDTDGTIASYDWDFGDGTTPHGTGKTPTHAYAAGGTYFVTLVVTDDQGKQSTPTTVGVTVTNPPANQNPTATFTSTPSGLNVAFDSSGTQDPDGTIASYDWTFGDGTAHGTTANPNHSYGAPGTFTVTLKVTDNQGGTATVSHDVTVSGPIAADNFNRTSASGWGNANTGGAWTPISGSATSFPVNGSVGQMKLTTNTTRAIGLNSVSGMDTDTTVKVSLDQLPTAGSYESIIVGSRQQSLGGYRTRVKVNGDGSLVLTLLCQPVTGGTCVKPTVANLATVPGVTLGAGQQLNIRLQTEGNGTTTLRTRVWTGATEPTTWQLTGTDTTAALQSPGGVYLSAFSPSTTTNAIVASWDDLSVSSGTVVTPPANQNPTAAFSSTATGLSVAFDSTGTQDPDGTIASYDWNWGDGTAHGNTANPSHTYAAGSYTVTLTVTDNQGGTATASHPLTVTGGPANQNPTAAFTSTATGLSVAFDSTGTQDPDGTIASYDWNWGDGTTHGTTANPSHTYAAGTYTATLTVTDNQGGTATVSHPLTVTGAAAPIAADNFNRTSASGWGNATTGGAWTPISGAAASFPMNGSVGQMKLPTNTTRAIGLNSVSGLNTDTVVKASLDQLPTAGSYESIIVGSRQQNLGGYRTRVKVNGDGSLVLTLLCQPVTGGTCVKPTVANLATVPGVTLGAGQQLNIRLQTEGNGTTTLRTRVWTGATEPTTWQLTGTDTTAALQSPGGVYLSAFSPSTTTNAIVASWDDLAVNPL